MCAARPQSPEVQTWRNTSLQLTGPLKQWSRLLPQEAVWLAPREAVRTRIGAAMASATLDVTILLIQVVHMFFEELIELIHGEQARVWKVLAQSEKSRTRRYRRQVCFFDTYKTVAGRLSRPTRCRVRCGSAVALASWGQTSVAQSYFCNRPRTKEVFRATACGSSPRHCHDGSVSPRPVFRHVCASGLCGHAAYRRDSSSQVSDWRVVSSLSIPFLCTCTEGAQRRGTAEHCMIVHETVNHLLRARLTERELEGLNFRSRRTLLSRNGTLPV